MVNDRKPKPFIPYANPKQPQAQSIAAMLREVPVGHALAFHVRPNAEFPGCCQIHRGDGAMAARITNPQVAPIIYDNAMALRANHGAAVESTFCLGVLCGMMIPGKSERQTPDGRPIYEGQ